MTRHALDCGLHCGLAECDCGAVDALPPLVCTRPLMTDRPAEFAQSVRLLTQHVIRLQEEVAALKRQYASEPLPPTE